MTDAGVHLGLDTCTPFLALALWSPGAGTLAKRTARVERGHAARLVPELEALLRDALLNRADIRAVTAGVGPGSYTGVRVGLAAAQALGTAWGVPVGGASTLAQIAWGALLEGESGAAEIDARRGNVYAGLYRREAGELLELAPVAKLPRETWRERLAGLGATARWLEDLPPDASWAASRPADEAPAEAVYL